MHVPRYILNYLVSYSEIRGVLYFCFQVNKILNHYMSIFLRLIYLAILYCLCIFMARDHSSLGVFWIPAWILLMLSTFHKLLYFRVRLRVCEPNVGPMLGGNGVREMLLKGPYSKE